MNGRDGLRVTVAGTVERGAELVGEGDQARPRFLEGMAVPYGVPVRLGDGTVETFARGAFGAEPDRWRASGRTMAFVKSHRGEPVAIVRDLVDTPDGLRFRAELLWHKAATAEYVGDVAAGINGVSIEYKPETVAPRPDGYLVQRGTLHAIAGAYAPAYEGARVQLRDQSGGSSTMETTTTAAAVTDYGAELQRRHADAQAAVAALVAGQAAAGGEPDAQAAAELQAAQGRLARLSAMSDAYQQTQARQLAERAAVTRAAGQAPASDSGIRITRDQLVYAGRQHSFLRDVIHAGQGDPEASGRLRRHYTQLSDLAERATIVSSGVGGAIANEYLPGLLVDAIAKGRPMGSFFQRIPVTDARPRIFPRVTTSTTVAKPSEGANPSDGDFATEAVSATPELYIGSLTVARTIIDGADPDAERMMLADMQEQYAQVTEAALVSAIESGAASGTGTYVHDTPHAGILAMIVRYRTARRLRAEAVFLPDAVYEGAMSQVDSTGRPLIPYMGPQNAAGMQTAPGADGGSVLGVPLIQSYASAPGTSKANAVAVVARAADAIYYESALLDFRYEQPAGPAAVKLGVYGYFVAKVRRAPGVRKHLSTAS